MTTSNANPDAVRIMTVHQAKGMQWPVVFLPSLLKNRFRRQGRGGAAVASCRARPYAIRSCFQGTIEDERRLFYVASDPQSEVPHDLGTGDPATVSYQKCSSSGRTWLVPKHEAACPTI